MALRFGHRKAQENKTAIRFFLLNDDSCYSGQELILLDMDSILNSNFNSSNPVTFLVHGFQSNRNSMMNKRINAAYRLRGKTNIIVVEWFSGSNNNPFEYNKISANLKPFGRQLALFIDFLNRVHKKMFDVTTVVGHSLGAHIAGIAGKHVLKGKIDTIIGLDPAGPQFSLNLPNDRLNAGDANYVQVIHTDDKLGFPEPIGDADFYPHGGEFQPDCSPFMQADSSLALTIADFRKKICSHSKAWQYFAESIESNQFMGIQCSGSFQKILVDGCKPTGLTMIMGGILPNRYRERGIFYVNVEYIAPVESRNISNFLENITNEKYRFRESNLKKFWRYIPSLIDSIPLFGPKILYTIDFLSDLVNSRDKRSLSAENCIELL